MVLTRTPKASLGESIPQFSLPATDGNEYTHESFNGAQVLVIVFTCNHCPYAKYAKPKLHAIYDKFKEKGAQFVAINSNEAGNYPEDSFEKMKLPEYSYPFPYLRDESQKVAKLFGAVCTPDLFVYDSSRVLVYRGQIDNGRPDHEVTSNDLEHVIQNLLDGKKVKTDQQPSTGCSIKWRVT